MKIPSPPAPCRAAFTRLELAVVVGTVGALMMLAWPALGANRSVSEVVECLSNSRLTAQAWLAYTIDNNDSMPGTIFTQNARNGKPYQGPGADLTLAPYQPWCTGSLTWDTNAHNTNTVFLTDPNYSTLAPYTKRNASIFQCAADKYVSATQKALGWTERARSVSANMYLGNGPAGPGDPVWEFTGLKARKMSDLFSPSPQFVFIFIEEHPDSMEDPEFVPPVQSGIIYSIPSSLHEGGAMINYADGRAELHRWSGPFRLNPVTYVLSAGGGGAPTPDSEYLRFRFPKIQ